jgi:hypothetical protein
VKKNLNLPDLEESVQRFWASIKSLKDRESNLTLKTADFKPILENAKMKHNVPNNLLKT